MRTCLCLLLLLNLACEGSPAATADLGPPPDAGLLAADGAPGGPDGALHRTDGAGPLACPRDLVGWVKDSHYIFRGTVARLGDATEAQPPKFADPQNLWDLSRMVVVRVDKSLHSPGSINLADFAGREITVRLPRPPTFSAGHQGYFLSRFWIAGKSLVLYGVAELDAARYPCVEGAVPAVLTYLRHKALHDRMLAASLVLEGQVTAVKDLELGLPSNYNPLWHEATVRVGDVLRGKPSAATVPVRFAASKDHMHYLKPKLTTGQRAVFMLDKDSVTGAKGPGFLVLHADQVQAPGQKTLLKKLLAQPPLSPL